MRPLLFNFRLIWYFVLSTRHPYGFEQKMIHSGDYIKDLKHTYVRKEFFIVTRYCKFQRIWMYFFQVL